MLEQPTTEKLSNALQSFSGTDVQWSFFIFGHRINKRSIRMFYSDILVHTRSHSIHLHYFKHVIGSPVATDQNQLQQRQ